MNYAQEGILFAVFDDRKRAEDYIDETVAPQGYDLIIRPVDLLS